MTKETTKTPTITDLNAYLGYGFKIPYCSRTESMNIIRFSWNHATSIHDVFGDKYNEFLKVFATICTMEEAGENLKELIPNFDNIIDKYIIEYPFNQIAAAVMNHETGLTGFITPDHEEEPEFIMWIPPFPWNASETDRKTTITEIKDILVKYATEFHVPVGILNTSDNVEPYKDVHSMTADEIDERKKGDS